MYTGPLDTEVVESMTDCDPEVRHICVSFTQQNHNLLNSFPVVPSFFFGKASSITMHSCDGVPAEISCFLDYGQERALILPNILKWVRNHHQN